MRDTALYRRIQRDLVAHCAETGANLDWLCEHMHPYFFVTMQEEGDAIVNLAAGLHTVAAHRKLTLVDRDRQLIVARLDVPGSLYETLRELHNREISYAELTHTYEPIPGTESPLEVQRFEFDCKPHAAIAAADAVQIPQRIRRGVRGAMERHYSGFGFEEFDKVLGLLWLNNEKYVRISPAERIARIMWLYQQGRRNQGLFLDAENTEDVLHHGESRVLFAVGNPPQSGFLAQVMEVFQRLDLGVRRYYSLNISTGVHPYFLGTFYVRTHDDRLLDKGSELVERLRTELYNTQILSTTSIGYTGFLSNGLLTGEEASLTNAFIYFCHTNLAHNQPDRYAVEAVKSAFVANPELTLRLVRLFRARFQPDLADREATCEAILEEIQRAIREYNTGHRYLDEIRRRVFETCLLLVRHTLKTNFFVPEKHALAFRLDPRYLAELGEGFTADLPIGAAPFRITFFSGRHGVGYHIGFSDIARGGWRTIVCRDRDEFLTNALTLFREVYVLAHTQHLKNKDIYEGGSKMTVVLDAADQAGGEGVTQRLYKLQYGFINAFLDLFVTVDGRARSPRVVDYYGEDEPIELGPDENMHDAMVELIARQALRRHYVLGIGIMSSKRVGINHKEYGVTSRGVVKFAEIAMREAGVNMASEPFTVKITGGTNGDVAGNALLLLLERCPQVRIVSIVAGSGALYDPQGADPDALRPLLLRQDVVDFDPEALHPGGYLLFRRQRRRDGLTELYRKLIRTDQGVEEQWVTTDELNRQADALIFEVPADLFLPCGGRPETIDESNWERLFDAEGAPTARVISEGANSYITPAAREQLQRRGILLLRDASANKCGVISSSYEIIANLLLKEKEFLAHKDAYVADVLAILERRAEEEANLIFQRRREHHGARLLTEISQALSTEINEHYARFFAFFQGRPELCDQPLFRKVLLRHLPQFVAQHSTFRRRVGRLPAKIKYAILAAELATYIVYHGGWELELEGRLRSFVRSRLT